MVGAIYAYICTFPIGGGEAEGDTAVGRLVESALVLSGEAAWMYLGQKKMKGPSHRLS